MEEGEQSAVVAATSAAAEKLQEAQPKVEKRNFICGVIEGFYGRPWTTEQRKDLFRKLKKWGMDSYVYAPKDDYKHRAYWRELYTVEEADHLTSLIAAARDSGVMFYYALSPGLDMTYSSQKELQTLKRKLDQVSQFGCEAFALLFDDIESELSKADKEVFQTFGNAQVSVTNEIYTHLGNPQFLFCPTQYCSSRAVPTVHDSEYLNTLGSKLNHAIDIMWTGDKVISKNITLESIQEITEVLRRPPVIWDNLHANDYDQKRVFLGPYSGRSPELIPHLRGVMTNPNCEFHANTIAIHTLAYWSQCSMDTKINSSLSADIKLETENEDGTSTEELPADCLSKNVYHPRLALKNAIGEWLSEFFVAKEAWGPITKPQPQVTMVMPIIPIIPSINTCMSLTTTTTTSATNSKTITAVPEVNTMQLQALADVCSTVNSSSMNPISNAVMNSLVSPTKVVTNDDILNPITTNAASNIELPKKIPISIVSVPIMHSKVIADADLVHNSDALESADQVDVSRQEDLLKEAPPPAAAVKNNVQQVEEAELKDNVEQGTTATITVQEKLNCDKPIEQKEAMHETNNLEGIMIDDKLLQNNNGITAPSNMIVVDAGEALSIDTINMLDEPIITNLSPLSVGNEPMECSSSLASQTSPKEALCKNTAVSTEDVVMVETASLNDNNSMQIESSTPSPLSNADMREVDETLTTIDESKITVEDLYLLCDLFYLPFEHGSRGFRLLNEFNWLKANANVLLTLSKESTRSPSPKPEVAEWLQRAESFSTQCSAVQELLKKIANCANKEICHDLFSYVWDITGALTLLNAFVKWLSLGHFPQNVYTYTQGSYTWFSKGWKEAYMSGDQEPWVFRGGLTADLQRLMPVDSGNDLFLYKLPELPTTDYNVLRPYTSHDEPYVYEVCAHAFVQLTDSEGQTPLPLPSHLRDLIADITVGPFITLSPEMCIVAHDSASNAIVGFAAAAMSVNEFYRNQEMCWMPAMREKYSATSTSGSALLNAQTQFTPCKKLNKMLSAMLAEYQRSDQDSNISRVENECPVEVINSYPAAITAAVLDETLAQDHGIMKRMLTVALATLRANGCFGVHVRLRAKDTDLVQYYTRMGFAEIYNDSLTKYLGRRF